LKKTFCGWTDVQNAYTHTDIPTDGYFRLPLMLLGRLRGVDLMKHTSILFNAIESQLYLGVGIGHFVTDIWCYMLIENNNP